MLVTILCPWFALVQTGAPLLCQLRRQRSARSVIQTGIEGSRVYKLQICANILMICRHLKCLRCSSSISLVVDIKWKNRCRFRATVRLFYICRRRVNNLGALIRFAAGARNFSLVPNALFVLGCFLLYITTFYQLHYITVFSVIVCCLVYFTTFYQIHYIMVLRRWLMWIMKLVVLGRKRPWPNFPSVCLVE
jgi:hypothetical protein